MNATSIMTGRISTHSSLYDLLNKIQNLNTFDGILIIMRYDLIILYIEGR